MYVCDCRHVYSQEYLNARRVLCREIYRYVSQSNEASLGFNVLTITLLHSLIPQSRVESGWASQSKHILRHRRR